MSRKTIVPLLASLGKARMFKRFAPVLIVLLGMAVLPSVADAGTPAWRLLSVTGPTNLEPYVHEQQTVAVSSLDPTFQLTFAGDTTPIMGPTPTPSPMEVQNALNALPSIQAQGSVTVTAGPLDSAFLFYDVTFDGGEFAGTDVPMLTTSHGSVALKTSATITVYATNVGGAATSSPYVVDVELPDGIVTSGPVTPHSGWTCTSGIGLSAYSCTNSNTVAPSQTAATLLTPVTALTPTEGVLNAEVTISGGGALAPRSFDLPIAIDDTPAAPGVQAMWAAAYDENGNPETRAGAHPFLAATAFHVNTVVDQRGRVVPASLPRSVFVDIPAGFVGNPLAAPRCSRSDTVRCAPEGIVGHASPIANKLGGQFPSGVANVLPPVGSPVQLTIKPIAAYVSTRARLRPDDYGVSTETPNIVSDYKGYGAVVAVWGDVGDAAFDFGRCLDLTGCPSTSNADAEPFLTNPTECVGAPLTTVLGSTTWGAPDLVESLSSESPAVTDCDDVPFEPVATIASTSDRADSASGLEFGLELPQEGLLEQDAIATSHLEDVVVDLPAGVAVNPSGATGLKGCGDAQIAPGTDVMPSCPDGSKIGAVEVTSPLVDHPIGGAMYLGTPKSTDPMSGQMLRLWVVARDDVTGTLIKLPGSTTADPQTGKLVATFENNPRLPFDHLSVKLKGGDRGVLAMPQTCGGRSIASTLSPWSGTADVTQSSPLDVTGDCSFGFAPRLTAGMSDRSARGTGAFSFKFSREDGEQWVDGLTAKLPKGLLATVKGLPLCSSGQAAAGACPEGSRIGWVDATAGSGDPFVLERKGTAYLTEGYKGCAYGLLVSVPVVAGPFDASSPETDLGSVNVRQAVCVDRTTTEVSAISDPIPTIWHGIPLRVRSVTVNIDRPGFMLNPSNCASKQVAATFDSERGATSATGSPFGVVGCSGLPFKPSLTLALTGKRQVTTGKHPGVKAKVTQAGVGEASIDRVVVRLPKSLALDPNNAQALCEFEDGTKPDLENHCPKGSIVGRARAVTPLLNQPLAGDVYFVKNVRRDPTTGNAIRTLPMLIVALRGEIAINLKGESDTTKAGKLVNTFASVPDGPITQFNMNIQGGSNGILAVTRTRRSKINLCASRHTAEADIDAQNTRRHDSDIRMKTPCTKKQTKAAKRAAARARAGSKRG